MADKSIFGFSGATNPNLKRAYHDKSFTNNMTARLGRAYPFLVEEAAPASTYKIRLASAFDMMPMVFPVQTNIRQHFGIWKIPYRILWKNHKDYISQVGNHVEPYIARSNNWCETGSLADYLGLPSDEVKEIDRVLSVDCPSKFAGSVSPMAVLGAVHRDDGTDYYQISGGTFEQFFTRSSVSDASQNLQYGFVTRSIPHLFSDDGLFFLNILHPTSGSLLAYNGAVLHVGAFVRHGSSTEPITWDFFNLGDLTFNNSTNAIYPYTTLEESTIRLDRTARDVSVPGGFKTTLVCRLASSSVSLINSHISESEVHLFLYWSGLANSSSLRLFGNLSFLSFIYPNLLTSSSSTELVEGESDKYVTNQSYSGFSGLTLDFSYKASIVDVASPEHNPFVIQSGDTQPKCPIDAYAFRAYEFLHNFVFRQERVTPFIKNGEEVYNEFLTNDGDGADSTTPVDFFNVPFEFDMFTTCVKTPQFGNAPLVGVSYNSDQATGVLHMVPSEGDPYDIGVSLDDNANVVAVSNYDEVADKPSVHRLLEAINFGISINDFRNVSAFQRFAERFMKAGYRYEDIIYEFFGTMPPTGEEFPEFVGGMTRDVNISKITNVAETETAYLGKFAGTGFVSGKSRTIKFRCNEPCLIMGLTWFSVTPVYSQFLPKHFTKHHYLDYFNPQFNSLGPQPVYKYQLNPFAETNWDKPAVFGYNRPWLDYVTRVDEVHGEFRKTMRNYLIQRYFAGPVELGNDFLYIDNRDLTDVFAVQTDTDKFFGQIRIDMQVKTPVARFAIPHIVG